MKLLRYGAAGAEKPGLLAGDGTIRDLSGHIDDVAGDVLTTAGLARLAALNENDLPVVNGAPRIGACVGNVGKFLCIGLNYSDHAEESGLEVPPEPVLFMKPADCICGPNDDVIIPRGSRKTDWEVELGVVIGDGGRYIDEADALNHVAGYCVINDVSEREFQIEHSGQWVKGKSSDNFGPIGPWLVTRDEVPDPQDLAMWLEVDGHRYQNGSTKTMIYGVAFIIAYLSKFMTLRTGDVITTGTPPGVGMGQKPEPIYLKPGNVIELSIDGLGTQRQDVVADDRS